MHEPYVSMQPINIDDRGSVYCIVDNMDELFGIKRTYLIHNWSKGQIRAWHGHRKGWTGLHVISGAAKLVAKQMFSENPIEYESWSTRPYKEQTLSEKHPGIFWVPPGWYNGSMSLVDNTRILVYSTQTFEEVKGDDERLHLQPSDAKEHFEVRAR